MYCIESGVPVQIDENLIETGVHFIETGVLCIENSVPRIETLIYPCRDIDLPVSRHRSTRIEISMCPYRDGSAQAILRAATLR